MTEQVGMFHSLFIIFSAAAFILFIISVVLFVLLRIPRIVGELSGSTARKEIRAIQAASEKKTAAKDPTVIQDILPEKPPHRYTPEAETVMLPSRYSNMAPAGAETYGETVVLGAERHGAAAPQDAAASKFVIIREIMLVHTDEVL